MISARRPVLAALLLAGFAACSKHDHQHSKAQTGSHAHVAPHGGTLVEVGEHASNLEILRDAANGRLTIWVLDGHAENFTRIQAANLELVATVGKEKRPLTLKAVANAATGETVGDTSQFEVQADWLKSAAAFEATVPTLEIRGTKFERIAFMIPSPAQ